MNDDYELLHKFFKIFNEYKSQTTGWPLHRIVKTKKGGTKRWRMSKERFDTWFWKNYISTGLMTINLRRWEYEKLGREISYEEHYENFFKSEFGLSHAVRKDFAIKVLTLGCVAPQGSNKADAGLLEDAVATARLDRVLL